MSTAMGRGIVLAMSVAALLLAACRAGENTAEQSDEAVELSALPQQVDSLAYPKTRRGRLTVRSRGERAIDGAWPARAEVCENPPFLQVLTDQPDVGTLVLVEFPASGPSAASYPVRLSDDTLPPPLARVAVQVLEARDGTAYQATRGVVYLDSFGERVSGKFRVTLKDVSSSTQLEYVGAFHDLSVRQLPEEWCQWVSEVWTERGGRGS